MVDSVHHALSKVSGGSDVEVVMSETGWPSADLESRPELIIKDNAQMYQNLIKYLRKVQPIGRQLKRSNNLEVYIFAMFNENEKEIGPDDTTERNYGLFYPNKAPVYEIEFN